MEEEEKELIEGCFKPSKWLYVLLFVFYTICICNIYNTIKYVWAFGFDEYADGSILDMICKAMMLLASIVSFYAIIKTLRGDSDCITSMKWALIYAMIYNLLDFSKMQIATYDLSVIWTIYLIKPTFYLTFYLFLCFSKSVRCRYAKEERRFGRAGWIWVAITIAFIGIIGVYGYMGYETTKYCTPIDVAELSLRDNEVSDGMIIFNDDGVWEKCKDTFVIDEADCSCKATLSRNDSTAQILLMTGRCDKYSERLQNIFITNTLYMLDDSIAELEHLDTIVNNNRLLATRFEQFADSTSRYNTIVSLAEGENSKIAIFLIAEKQDNGLALAKRLATSVIFDVASRSIQKRINYKRRSHNQKKIRDGVENNHKKPRTELPGGFAHGHTPRHPLGEVLLKSTKGEKAQCHKNGDEKYIRKAHN